MNFKSLSKFAAASLACGSFLAADVALRDAKAQFGRPVTVAVRKVQDQAGASWWRKSFEKVLQKMLSTELTNSGNFTVVGRQSEALAEIQAELNMAGVNQKNKLKENKTPARYIVMASLTDFSEAASESGGGGITIMGFGGGKKTKTVSFNVAFDLEVYDTSTSVIAYSRTIQGTAKAETKSTNMQGSYGGISVGNNKQVETKLPIKPAIRQAMVESAEYLNCVLYLKDECIDEYDAKDAARKEANSDALDMW